MLTRRRLVVAVLLAVVLTLGYALHLPTLAHVGAGYSAQQTCACLFVSGRPLENCKGELEPLAQKLVSVSAGERAVTARAMLFSSATSRYEDGFGCSLVD